MKVIIAGPRDYEDYEVLCEAIEASEFEITEVVSGGATGVDTLGERWAVEHNVPVTKFPAEWKNVKQAGAIVAKNKWGGNYNKNAGFFRNNLMAEYAGKTGGLIAIDTGSPGTGGMIKDAKKHGVKVFRYNPEDNLTEDKVGYTF